MKRLVPVVAPLLLVLASSSFAVTGNSSLLRSVQQYEKTLVLPDGAPAGQRKVWALSMAIAETGITDPAQISAALAASPQAASTLKSDTSFTWSSAWDPVDRTTYGYNGSNQRTSAVTEVYSGATWSNSGRTLYTYNGGGLVDSTRTQIWQGSAWVDQQLSVNTYSGSLLSQTITQNWSGSAWVNSRRVTYTMAGSVLASVLVESWQSNAWVNAQLLSHTYDGSNRQLTTLAQTWSGSAWDNQSLTTNTYNGSGDLQEATTQFWQSSAWTNVSRHGYAYNGSHLEILDTTSSWLATMWLASYVDSLKYTSNRLTEQVHMSLFGAGGNRTDYTYDVDGNQTLEVSQDWNLGTQQWDNTDKVVSVYTGSTSCCIGSRGNVNGTGIIDAADLSALVSYLGNTGYVLPCTDGANVNGTGIIDAADLATLTSYLTNTGLVLPSCP